MSDMSTLNQETNARFWAQTGYKPGHKLDDNDPSDRAMRKAWMDVYAKVRAEDQAGALHLSYNNPDVKQGLSDAHVAHEMVVQHLDAAAKEPDPTTADEHVRAAATANSILLGSLRNAQKQQLPTVSPEVVHEAAKDATAGAGMPPPRPPKISPRHPASSSPSAKPALPEGGSTTGAHGERVQVFAPQTAREHHAVAQAGAAPQVAADAHHGHRVASSVHSRAINGARALAHARRAAIGHGYVGFAIMPNGSRIEQTFPSREALRAWYDGLAHRTREFVYVAAFEPDVDEPTDLFGDADVVAAVEPQLAELGPPPATAPQDAPALPPVASPQVPPGGLLAKDSTLKIVAIGAGIAAAVGLAAWALSRRATVAYR